MGDRHQVCDREAGVTRAAEAVRSHRLRRSDTEAIPVELAHTLRAAELPDLHRDPFDRLIIAQAQILHLPIITADKKFDGYDVTLIAA